MGGEYILDCDSLSRFARLKIIMMIHIADHTRIKSERETEREPERVRENLCGSLSILSRIVAKNLNKALFVAKKCIRCCEPKK